MEVCKIRRTTLIIWLGVATLAGLALGRVMDLGGVLPLAGVGSLVALTGRRSTLGWAGLVLLGGALGLWRGAQLTVALQPYKKLEQGTVLLNVRAAEDGVYGTNGQLKFTANHIVDVWTGDQLPGQISVSGRGLNGVYQGDEIIVSGKLRPGIGSYQGFASYTQLELVAHHSSPILDLRRKFGAGMLSALPEPLGSFGMGLLIGARATLPDDVKDNLQRVGLTHIIAVSGANLTIMLEASRRLLGKSSKRLSYGLSAILMMLFVLMTGGSASIIRAAYVSGLSMLAAYYGRRVRPLLLITLVAAVTAFINPQYVWGDASWYLSFLAFFGVLMVSPLLQKRLPRAFSTNLILGIVLESLCAEIMSIPFVLFTFGQMSFVGLLANVLVVSVIPYAMLLSLIAGIAGTFLWPVAGWFSWPAKLLLMYMLDTAGLIARWSGGFANGIWLNVPGLVITYVVIAVMVGLLGFKDRQKSAIITDNEP